MLLIRQAILIDLGFKHMPVSFLITMATLFFFGGAAVASFSGLVYWRLKQMPSDGSIIKTISLPRSHCDHCHKVLTPIELVPIIGWCLSLGRCRNCHQEVPMLFPFSEFVLGALSAGVFCYYQSDIWNVLLILMLLWGVSILAVIDLALHIIPDELSWPLLFLGLLFSPFEPDIHLRVAGAAFGFSMIWGTMALTSYMMDFDNIAWGDITMGAVIGAWLGIFVAPICLFVFCIIFFVSSLPAMRRGDVGAPCAPAFAAALVLIAPFHDQILKIYW